MGLIIPKEGNISFDGKRLIGLRPHQIASLGIGFVTEDRRIFPSLTVLENLNLPVFKKREEGWGLKKIYEFFVSLVIALVVGFLSIRVKEIYFVMVTLAFCQMFYFIALKWSGLTGGDNGLHGVPRPSVGPIHLDSEIRLYYLVLMLFVLCLLLALRIVHPPFGRALQSLKNNEDRAKSIGFNTNHFKLISFLISAFFGALAGGLYALHLNFVPLETLNIMTSGDVVIMSIIGGIGTL